MRAPCRLRVETARDGSILGVVTILPLVKVYRHMFYVSQACCMFHKLVVYFMSGDMGKRVYQVRGDVALEGQWLF